MILTQVKIWRIVFRLKNRKLQVREISIGPDLNRRISALQADA